MAEEKIDTCSNKSQPKKEYCPIDDGIIICFNDVQL